MQEDLHNRKEQEKVQGNVIVAELVGDSKCPSLEWILCVVQPINLGVGVTPYPKLTSLYLEGLPLLF